MINITKFFKLTMCIASLFLSTMAQDTHDDVAVRTDTLLTDTTQAAQIETDTIPEKKEVVYLFQIHDEIDPAATRITEKAIEEAEKNNADYLLLDLDTYGGLVVDADAIRTALLETEIPTMVFIRNNAASAGALISIACDSIYMNTGSTIGAAAVVNQDGTVMPEKYQSYMRNKMRATAEATNRDPDIAEGMVDPRVVIEGITDSTRIITFSVDEAIYHGFCNSKAGSIEDVLEIAGIDRYELMEHKVSGVESIIQFLVKPAVSGVLLLILIGGIYFELQSPGIGFPLAAAIVAATLYFAPLYLEGLAANWEIALFMLGLILLIAELFFIPGFGIAGVAGISCIVFSLALALVRNLNGFDFSFVPMEDLGFSFLMVTSIMLGGLTFILYGSSGVAKSALLKRLALGTEQKREDGFVISAAIQEHSAVGKEGIAITDLRPSGKIEINGEWHDAQSDAEYIEEGDRVYVERVHGAYLVVRKCKKDSDK